MLQFHLIGMLREVLNFIEVICYRMQLTYYTTINNTLSKQNAFIIMGKEETKSF